MSVAFLFPGQGSQYGGMLHDLPDHPVVHDIIQKAGEELGRDALELDSQEALKSNVSAQLALLIAGVASALALDATGATADFVAGHSIGAFAAAVACGALDFRDAVRVVELRASAMRDSYPEGYGMGVILGLDERTVTSISRQIDGGEGRLYSTNVNAPLQVSVSGSDSALEEVMSLARESGASRTELLHVPSPSHSPLMNRVADTLREELDGTRLSRPMVPYVSNVGGRPLREPDAIREDLAGSVAAAVRWHDATTLLYESTVRLFVEMPPGETLARLAADAFPDARSFAIGGDGFESAQVLIGKEKASAR